MARLLFLGASVSQLPAIRYARASGHTIIACDGDPDAAAFELCDVAEVVDFSDVDAVTAVGKRERADGVLAICTDRAVVPAALIAARLGLAGLDVEVARAMTDKPTMRARLAAQGVPQPRHTVLAADGDRSGAAAIPLPAVLKPADSGGQRGLSRIERLDQLNAALPVAIAASRSGVAMLEEYVDGHEVNTLFAVRDGMPTLLTISDRLRPGGVGFGVGWIHMFPSSLSRELATRVEDTAADAIRALGLRDGIAFPQLLVTPEGSVVVVEVAARIAAGQMADLVRHGTGIELFGIAILQSLGAPVPDEAVIPKFARPIAIRFLTAAPGLLPLGTVTAISGLDRVRSAPGVLDAGLYFGPGTTIGPLQVDADRRGYVMATGSTAEEALYRANSAARYLRIKTAENAGPSPGRRRWSSPRLVAPVVCAVLAVAAAGAFLITEHAKPQPHLVSATHVDKTFSPVCKCREDVARIAFRVLRPARLAVSIVNGSGASVDTLMRARHVAAHLIHLAWNGRGTGGKVLPSGIYFPDVDFLSLHRQLRLPDGIALDLVLPVIRRAVLLAHGARVAVRYRFSEPAHALLYVGGRRVVDTRFSSKTGTVRWSEPRVQAGAHAVTLVAVDLAGNRSLPDRLARAVGAGAPTAARRRLSSGSCCSCRLRSSRRPGPGGAWRGCAGPSEGCCGTSRR